MLQAPLSASAVMPTATMRSGQERPVPLQFFPDGDDMIVVTANSGLPSPPGWYCNLTANPLTRVEVGELAQRGRVERQRLLAPADDRVVGARRDDRLRLRRVGGADRVGALDEVPVREPAVAAPGDEQRGQPCSSESTSPASGNRRSLRFEKTTVPSRTTSNWPLPPVRADASMPTPSSSATRLVARAS